MIKQIRQQLIIEELYKNGKVSVDALAELFSLSKDTIRRDLNDLEATFVLKRVYGGAILFHMPIPDYSNRTKQARKEKYIIAKKALEHIREESFIAMDGGSTTTMLASIIPRQMKLDVITNSYEVALELKNHPHVNVTIVGGRFLKKSQTSVGEVAVKQLRDYHFDQCFIGVHAVNEIDGLMVPYEDEVGVKAAFILSSEKVHLLCVMDKVDERSRYSVCSFDAIDTIITEQDISPEQMKRYENKLR